MRLPHLPAIITVSHDRMDEHQNLPELSDLPEDSPYKRTGYHRYLAKGIPEAGSAVSYQASARYVPCRVASL
jgi:hypothetical protein